MIGEGHVKGIPGTPPNALVAAARASEKAIAAELSEGASSPAPAPTP